MSTSLELVEQTIEHARTGIVVVCGPESQPTPLTTAQRSAIDATKVTLPASMERWLAFDAPSLDLFDAAGDAVAITTLTQFLVDELEEISDGLPDDMLEEMRGSLGYMLGDYATLSEKPAIVLPPSASQAHLLVLDGSDEPPVLGYEKEEFWEKYPSFGACIAHLIGNRDYEEIGPEWARTKT
ncbi:MAG: hypothetical protein AAGE52_13410 [Myxococcota bacterium]